MKSNKTPILETLIMEIEKLQRAKQLLEEVYVEIGPYKDGKPKPETWSKVCDFFGFDDSE